MFQCAEDELAYLVLKSNPSNEPLDTVLEKLNTFSVIPTAIGVMRADLLEMKQKRDEPFRGLQPVCVVKQRPASSQQI